MIDFVPKQENKVTNPNQPTQPQIIKNNEHNQVKKHEASQKKN